MIHYDEVFFGNVSGGAQDGWCAVQVELGTARSVKVDDLVRSLLAFNRSKILRVTGEFKHTPDEDLATLFTVLSENGYSVGVELDGQRAPLWLTQVGYRIVRITEAPWLMYAADELHFKPLALDPIEPPTLQPIHMKAVCYLDVSREMTPRQIFDFLKRYPLWRLWAPPSKVYRMPIEVKVEEEV